MAGKHPFSSVKSIFKEISKYSLPLVPNQLSWWVVGVSDRTIISYSLSVAANGIYSVANKFSAIYITFYNIFNMSWTESVALHINDEDAKEFLNNMINTMLKFFTAMGIGIIACMPFVYPIMINSKFAEGYTQVPIMLIGSIFNVVVGLESAIYIANKNTKAVANTSIISATINIVVNLLLIRFVGLYAATISTLTAYLVMSIYRLYDLKKRHFEVKIETRFIIITIITLIPILIAYYSNNMTLYISGLIIAILYAYCINKKNLNKIIKMVLKRK